MNKKRHTLKNLKAYFFDHNLLHYASSLSFHTILALIPILILSFYGFSKLTFFDQFYAKIKAFIFSSLIPTQQENVSVYLDTFLQNTNSLGLIGVVFVLYVSIMFFDDFEYVVNKIFNTKPRDFFHSISIFLAISILTPIGLAFSFFLSAKANLLLKSSEYTRWIDFLSFYSYFTVFVLFALVFYISANTKVYPKSAMISAFVTSFVWYASKTFFIYYVAYNKTYTTIYGSFSTIMFFFLWIYLSWIIFLFGLKLCYILNENRKKH